MAVATERVEASPAAEPDPSPQPLTRLPAAGALGNRAMAAIARRAIASRPPPPPLERRPRGQDQRFPGAERLLARAVQERRACEDRTGRVLARQCDPAVSNCGDRNDPRNYVSFEDFRAGAAAPYSEEALREMWDQAHPPSPRPASSTSSTSSTSSRGQDSAAGNVRLNVHVLTDAETRSLGLDPATLPENTMVPVPAAAPSSSGPSIVAPAGAGAAYFAPSPFSFIPPNSTGVLWTQGHTSIFANPNTALLPTLRGYRGNLGYYLAETVPGVGRGFTIRLHEGVPGSFANDAAFPLFPGEQNYLYVARDAEAASQFAARLRTTEYGGEYTYSPPRAQADPVLGPVGRSEGELYEILVRRGQAPMCTNNCITVPVPEIEGAIGTRPTTTSGVDVTTGQGPSGVEPAHAGRGRLMTDAMTSGPLPEGVGRLRVTPGAGNAMFVIRGGGAILLVYGAYHTEERVRAAVGTPQLGTVVAEESGAWIGGILGSALGGAAAGAIFCAPTGPVDAVCVVGGFVGGLVVGMAGGTVGAEVGHAAAGPIGGAIDAAAEQFGRLHQYLEYEIYRLYNVPYH